MRYLKQEEVDEIKRLRQQKMMVKDIAKKFMVCEATVSNIVNGKFTPKKFKSVPANTRSPYDPIVFKEEILSILPDDILFEHSKERDFIG